MFIDLGRKDRILPILIGESKEECIPEMIRDIPVIAKIEKNDRNAEKAIAALFARMDEEGEDLGKSAPEKDRAEHYFRAEKNRRLLRYMVIALSAILVILGMIDTVLTVVGRKGIGIEGPVRKIDSFKGVRFCGFFRKFRTEEFAFNPVVEVGSGLLLSDFERNNTARCKGIYAGSFHYLIGTAVGAFARYGKRIVNSFGAAAFADNGFLFSTPVAVGFLVFRIGKTQFLSAFRCIVRLWNGFQIIAVRAVKLAFSRIEVHRTAAVGTFFICFT